MERDLAKCQLQTYALFRQFPYSGRKTNEDRHNVHSLVKKMIWKEQIDQIGQKSKDSWISDEYTESNESKIQLSNDNPSESNHINTKYNYDDYPDIICELRNTLAYKGKCICTSGHPYGDPYTTGCWGCSNPCASGATCISEDLCRCPNFYVGDGIRNCTLHIPVVRMARGRIPESTAEVIIDEVPWRIPSNLYCKIGYDVTPGVLITKNKIECKSVAPINSRYLVSVSWDRVAWSSGEIYLEYENIPWVFTLTQFCLFLVLCFLSTCVLFRYYKKFRKVYETEADLFDLAMEI
ncbi:hypothetical protein TVAG_252750 [Trichomonas vaginalis G3]|uniref:EGF-like domain-containing protein n=1 Tax=Trichomonas vaginalis (strain ATCC PRA-98 / G3) TaxID=412133 RepID=A2DW17_TRIV3|nr:hypothetical protein TVAGG3_0845170 [Trichomonas vaginalis G3]EAY15462.1 hypothetical protein TVAG_252750 [Trichomonas vaginalis G3]KAI5499553.1 hypothetical protein TVAGG3_0845170 [Trichomonas vaginalis G3]|eukprot:XP_001327685.1 hypothetical protein [Trichomonas vaginalis G3]